MDSLMMDWNVFSSSTPMSFGGLLTADRALYAVAGNGLVAPGH
jgi:hypothetical protein